MKNPEHPDSPRPEAPGPINRRGALALGGGLTAGLLASGGVVGPASAARRGGLPVKRMEEILRAQGSVTNGVLGVGIDRTDIGPVTLRGTPIAPSFGINGDLTFQPLPSGQAFFNGDLPLKADEVDPVIDAILGQGLVFQAEHQHFYDFDPPVWFVHFRGQGSPLRLARAVHRVLEATSTPLPQAPPQHSRTPLDPDRLQRILHGYDAEVSDGGVVTVFVARTGSVTIDGVRVRPQANIANNVAFQPLDASGSVAAVAPDFALEAGEINRVMKRMRHAGWDIGCLYNQETDEHPQLYFSHQFKTGDPYQLAHEVRRALDQTKAE